MSEINDLPTDHPEQPLRIITGTLTEEIYMRGIRIRSRRRALRTVLLYLLFCAVLMLCLGLWVSASQPGDMPNRRGWLQCTWDTMTGSPGPLAAAAVFCVILAASWLWYAPSRIRRQFRERYPDGSAIAYAFYEEYLETAVSNAAEKGMVRLRYADVRKRIEETDAYWLLTTAHRNTRILHKAVMTPDEIAWVRDLLRSRCPQHR